MGNTQTEVLLEEDTDDCSEDVHVFCTRIIRSDGRRVKRHETRKMRFDGQMFEQPPTKDNPLITFMPDTGGTENWVGNKTYMKLNPADSNSAKRISFITEQNASMISQHRLEVLKIVKSS